MTRFNIVLAIVLLAGLCTLHSSSMQAQAPQSADAPRFAADNELARPENYREWIYLSSGIGMSYNAAANNAAGPANPPFDNVFVTPSAYRSFLQTGTWPEQTMFVLELRGSASEGSINKQGRFQQQVLGIEVEVKDSSRFPGKWAFFEFGRAAATSRRARSAGGSASTSCTSSWARRWPKRPPSSVPSGSRPTRPSTTWTPRCGRR